MSDTETRPDDVRKQVREAYTQAVTDPDGGCCGTASATEEMKGTVAKIAGYDPSELANLPADAVTNAFGCGDPVTLSAIEPGQTVLDLGSGAGIDVLLAAARVGPTGRVIGVDMTPAMIERARANAAAAGLTNVDIREGVIEALPVDDASVDWVISNCVINLSPDKPAVFAELARVLAPGGQISISDIVVETLPAWMRNQTALHSACIAGAIPEADYVRGLETAGLVDVEVTQRIVYDDAQLRDLLASEELEQVSGKIWSARFTGRAGATGASRGA